MLNCERRIGGMSHGQPHHSSKKRIGMAKNQSWAGRQVVVSGGSSGLGLQLVMAAANQKANLVIVGRDMGRLEKARLIAIEQGANSAIWFAIDLRSSDSGTVRDSDKLHQWLIENNVDLLINAVGRSDRGLLEQLDANDLMAMFQDNVLCTWNMTLAAIPSLKRAKGTIVNIGSLAGLIAAPNMGGYSIVKYGLTALSRQLRLELESSGIHVTLVCPGPIARDDTSNRYSDVAKKRGLNEAYGTAPAGGAKLRLIDPKKLSEMILDAAGQRRKELVYPGKARWLASLAPIWPNLADRILQRYTK